MASRIGSVEVPVDVAFFDLPVIQNHQPLHGVEDNAVVQVGTPGGVPNLNPRSDINSYGS